MKKYTFILLVLISKLIIAQDVIWDKINADNSAIPNETIKCITFDTNGNGWVGTYMGGIALFQNDTWTVYNSSNSGLPHNYINSIAIDKNNVKWIGTDGGGLTRFDGNNWEVFKTSNSDLPSNVVMAVYCDGDGTIWAGTYFGGLAHFDEEHWVIYNDENSPLLSNKIVALTKDKNGLLWVGTQGSGVASFDGKSWIVYTEENSKLPGDHISSIAIDENNIKWVGTGGGGVAMFNDSYWKYFNTKNSTITDDNIRPVLVDKKGYKWIGTYIGGLCMYNGENWRVFDYQNSSMPDDEITSLAYHNNKLYIGTERSGIITAQDNRPDIIPAMTEKDTAIENTSAKPISVSSKNYADPTKLKNIKPVGKRAKDNKIVLVFDAADVYFNEKRIEQYVRSYKLLLKNRERINDNYFVSILIYSSNYDVDPKKIQLTERQLHSIFADEVVFLEGETKFPEGISKAFSIIKENYNTDGNNHVIAATHKFIRDDETAKVVIKDNIDNHNIVFSLLAFKTESWKMEHKMRKMIPQGKGHYYVVNPVSIKDNWSLTGQIGFSAFRGDMDVENTISIPGVFGIAVNKQILSTGLINGGIKGQFNFGRLKGSKNDYTFENNYKEMALNFQVILNRWFNSNFKFEKIRPYGFMGIGFINYRVLLRNKNGDVVNYFGYKLTSSDNQLSKPVVEKDRAVTDLIFPVGAGINYRLNDRFNLEIEMSTRFINSDKLDGKVKMANDKYIFVSLGVTYNINSKDFLADILNK